MYILLTNIIFLLAARGTSERGEVRQQRQVEAGVRVARRLHQRVWRHGHAARRHRRAARTHQARHWYVQVIQAENYVIVIYLFKVTDMHHRHCNACRRQGSIGQWI